MKLQMYVFEDVLYDYTGGMAMIAEYTLEDAQALAFEEFGLSYRDNTLEEFLDRDSGFREPAGVYPLLEGTPGVKHFVYGGG